MQLNTEYIQTGAGISVVMLHSSMSSKDQWLRLLTDLSPDYHAIAIDLYGYGDCTYPQDHPSFTLVDEATRLDSIITQVIGTERFHLVGHSYGAATALRFAFANQERLISLSLFEPVAFHLLDREDPALMTIIDLAGKISLLLEKRKYSLATRMFVDFWSGEGTYNTLSATKKNALERFIPKVSLDFQAGITEPLTLDNYKQIEVPVCLITSSQSPLSARRIVASLTATLPNVETHLVDGGHMAPIGNAPAVNRIWKTFIDAQ